MMVYSIFPRLAGAWILLKTVARLRLIGFAGVQCTLFGDSDSEIFGNASRAFGNIWLAVRAVSKLIEQGTSIKGVPKGEIRKVSGDSVGF